MLCADAMASGKEEAVRFLMYNVKNYFVKSEPNRTRYDIYPKKDSSCEAVVDVIASVKPDIIGLTEMGGKHALADLQSRLRKRGLDYKYSRVLERDGASHALALLSRYPIARDDSKANYGLYGQQNRKMLRGILDVTVRVGEKRSYRILGAHLKARRGGNSSEAASLRRREAETLSQYIAANAKKARGEAVLVYGDWNDEPQDVALRSLKGVAKLGLVDARDAAGKAWTLYFHPDKKYLVLDHIYMNRVLQQRQPKKARAGVVNHRSTRHASDHRAVWCDLY